MNIKNSLTTNGYDNLNQFQEDFRLMILNQIVDKGGPITWAEVRSEGKRRGFSLELVELTLNKFKEEQYFISDEEEIQFMYPVSSQPTIHRVTLADGRSFHAMCAIDSLGSAVTFNQDIDINSSCFVTGREVKIEIRDGKYRYVNNPDLTVLHVNIKKYTNWASSC